MWDVGLAKMFKDRDIKSAIGPCIGKVTGVNPLKVSILDGQVVLQKDNLYICSSLLGTYTRQYEVIGEVQLQDTDCGDTDSVNDGGQGASNHSHTIETIDIDTDYNARGTIAFTDTLKEHDEVLLIPAENEQIFFIVDKVRKVGG